MSGFFSEPRKMILTLVPKVSTDRQGGAAEPASPRLLVDVAVSRRQKTGALVAGELALSRAAPTRIPYGGTPCFPVEKLQGQGRAGPVVS